MDYGAEEEHLAHANEARGMEQVQHDLQAHFVSAGVQQEGALRRCRPSWRRSWRRSRCRHQHWPLVTARHAPVCFCCPLDGLRAGGVDLVMHKSPAQGAAAAAPDGAGAPGRAQGELLHELQGMAQHHAGDGAFVLGVETRGGFDFAEEEGDAE